MNHKHFSHKSSSNLQTIRDNHNVRSNSKTLYRLRKYSQTYKQTPFDESEQLNEQQRMSIMRKHPIIDQQTQKKYRSACADLDFHVKVFARIFKDSTRKKSILTKLHGWDEDTFAGVLFKGQELRKDLTAEGLFDQLGLSRRSLDSRNIYNKLRLFLSQLKDFNQRQQQKQAKYQRGKLCDNLIDVERQIKVLHSITKDNRLREYLERMSQTHREIRLTKLKVHDKHEILTEIVEKTGNLNLNFFHVANEKYVSEMEKFIQERS